jgi:hypothetical protein
MENIQVVCWRIQYTVVGWRIHKLIVGIHSFWWRIHKLIVGEYIVFTIGNPLRKLRIHSFWAENTQVDCWRIHSFHYMKSPKEL